MALRRALLPFVPPFLRVNAATLDELRAFGGYAYEHMNLTTLKWVLLVALWGVGLYAAEQVEIAPLFVMGTILYAVLTNLGDKAVDSVEIDENGNAVQLPSAYSVFNRGKKRLPGQLTTEHFEDQLRHRIPGREDEEARDEDDQEDAQLQEALRRSLEDAKKTKRNKRKPRC